MDVSTAYSLHQAGRYADAARIYQALLERDPDDPTVLHLFGVMHHQCGHSARAVELIGRAIALRPEVAAYHANLAEAQRSLGQHEEAAASCRAALRLQPDISRKPSTTWGWPCTSWVDTRRRVAQYDAALALRPRLRPGPEQPRHHAAAAGQDRRRPSRPTARRSTLDPTLGSGARQPRADARRPGAAGRGPGPLPGGRAAPARPGGRATTTSATCCAPWSAGPRRPHAYAEAIRLQPDLAVAHANLGLTLQHQGKHGAALPHFRRAAELAPDDAGVCAATGQRPRPGRGLGGGHLDSASGASSCKPEDADAHNELGWAYQSDGRAAEAEAAYRRALELQPDHLDAWLNLGSLHEELGAMAEAEACYREAEDRQPRSPLPLARRAVLRAAGCRRPTATGSVSSCTGRTARCCG